MSTKSVAPKAKRHRPRARGTRRSPWPGVPVRSGQAHHPLGPIPIRYVMFDENTIVSVEADARLRRLARDGHRAEFEAVAAPEGFRASDDLARLWRYYQPEGRA